jgi:hypothetical protein
MLIFATFIKRISIVLLGGARIFVFGGAKTNLTIFFNLSSGMHKKNALSSLAQRKI